MVIGRINAFYEAVIPIRLQDVKGIVHEFTAVVDTGFNGTLTLPSKTIALLGLPWRTRGSAALADGSEGTFDIYAATILWDGLPRPILVEAVEMMPLVGMRLLADHDLQMRVQPGGAVKIVAVRKHGESRTR
ncbi:MAG: clan AA aspartic protease [Planctomycetes bacterium]|nr:clan AA aspartic protease [Planctomycetota bacterium]